MSMTMMLPNYGQTTQKIVAWINPMLEKRPKFLSLAIALALHAVFFLAGGAIFIQAPQYGVDGSRSGVDVYLVAAPIHFASVPEAQPAAQPDQMTIPVPQPSESQKIKGDGSSAIAGKNQTTFSSAGGGQTDIKPGYLKNPPPAYPSAAIQKGQEGLVVLSVLVDRSGKPQIVDLKQSSGFELLDAAALKAVKKWKFSPGKVGVVVAESEVTIPVRFRLQDVKRK